MERFALFDFDGTLVDSNGVFVELIYVLMERCGLARDRAFVDRAETMNQPEFCRAMSELSHGQMSPAEVDRFTADYVGDFYGRCPLKPGAKAYLERLAARGARLCIASATEEAVIRPVLRRLEIEPLFDFVATVFDVNGVGKTRPDLFLYAMERFGGRDPGECMLYDDALGALRCAKNAGLRVTGVYDASNEQHQPEIRALCDRYFLSFEGMEP